MSNLPPPPQFLQVWTAKCKRCGSGKCSQDCCHTRNYHTQVPERVRCVSCVLLHFLPCHFHELDQFQYPICAIWYYLQPSSLFKRLQVRHSGRRKGSLPEWRWEAAHLYSSGSAPSASYTRAGWSHLSTRQYDRAHDTGRLQSIFCGTQLHIGKQNSLLYYFSVIKYWQAVIHWQLIALNWWQIKHDCAFAAQLLT